MVFSGNLILPQFFRLGSFVFRYYGIIMAIAVLAGWFLAKKRASKYGINGQIADDIIFWTVLGGFLGARVYHIFSSFEFYLKHPINVFKIWQGGLSIFGAILGGVIMLFIFKKIFVKNLKLSAVLDWLAPSVVLGQIIGRFGNFFNYEAFGYPTNLFWKMFVPESFRPVHFFNFNYFHPWFLYEILGNCLIFFLLVKLEKKQSHISLFWVYLLCYNLLRFSLEFLRIDSIYLATLRLNTITTFSLVFLAIFVLGLKKVLENVKIS